MGSFLSIAQVGLGIAGSLMQYQGQMAAYQEQLRFRAEQEKQAQETLLQQAAQQDQQTESELNKVQNEKFEATRTSMQAASRATAAAAESGVTGLSVANLMGSNSFEENLFTGKLDYNTEVYHKQSRNSLRMAQRGAEARVASIPIPTKPSFGPTLINIGSNIVGGLQQSYKSSKPQYGTPGVHLYG